MASKQIGPVLPEDKETLRFYLDGIHDFIQSCQGEIASVEQKELGTSPGRLFVAIQGVVEVLLGPAKPHSQVAPLLGDTSNPTSVSQRAVSVTPGFLAIQPFLNHGAIAKQLARCKSAAEATGTLPASGGPRAGFLFEHRRPVKIVKGRPSDKQKESSRRAEEQSDQRIQTAVGEFNALLKPFHDLEQRIIVQLGGVEEQAAPGSDDSDFRPAKEIIAESQTLSTYRRLNAFLAKHPEVRRRHPTKRRLEVHVGELYKALNAEAARGFDALDKVDVYESIADDFVLEARARKQKIHQKRKISDAPAE
jgi:hypothetical protein